MLAPIHGLSRGTVKSILCRVDSGANMIVGNQKSQFSRLTLKRIGVELGTAAQGHFEGVGIIIVSIPENPTEVILLYPSYYSPTDKCPTISTGVLKSTTYFTDVIHHANNKLVLLPSSNSTPLRLPCTVIDGIDFISLCFHTIHNSSSQQKCNKNSIQPEKAKSSVNKESRQFRFKSLQPLINLRQAASRHHPFFGSSPPILWPPLLISPPADG